MGVFRGNIRCHTPIHLRILTCNESEIRRLRMGLTGFFFINWLLLYCCEAGLGGGNGRIGGSDGVNCEN